VQIKVNDVERYRGWLYAQFEQDLLVLFVGLHFDLFSQLDDWFEMGVVLFLCLDQ